MGTGMQRMQFEQQRSPQPIDPNLIAQNISQETQGLPPVENQQQLQGILNTLQSTYPTSTQQTTVQPSSQPPQKQIFNALFPTAGHKITSMFGNRPAPMPGASTYHQGIDIAGQLNSPINSAMTGLVQKIGMDKASGNYAKILGDDGRTYTYAHANKFTVPQGSRVNAGQPIGFMGSTGISTAPHLHFAVSENGKYIDPMTLYKGLFGGK